VSNPSEDTNTGEGSRNQKDKGIFIKGVNSLAEYAKITKLSPLMALCVICIFIVGVFEAYILRLQLSETCKLGALGINAVIVLAFYKMTIDTHKYRKEVEDKQEKRYSNKTIQYNPKNSMNDRRPE
jgi:hypothetical protein